MAGREGIRGGRGDGQDGRGEEGRVWLTTPGRVEAGWWWQRQLALVPYRRCVSRPALESSRRKPQGGSRAGTPDMQTASMHITHATASNGEILWLLTIETSMWRIYLLKWWLKVSCWCLHEDAMRRSNHASEGFEDACPRHASIILSLPNTF